MMDMNSKGGVTGRGQLYQLFYLKKILWRLNQFGTGKEIDDSVEQNRVLKRIQIFLTSGRKHICLINGLGKTEKKNTLHYLH